jgi:hypothetical protein
MKSKPSVLCLVAALTLLPIGLAATNPQSAAHTDAKKAQITILYDGFGKPSTMEAVSRSGFRAVGPGTVQAKVVRRRLKL